MKKNKYIFGVETIEFSVPGDYTDPVAVWHEFLIIVNGLTGVTVMSSIQHLFPGGGLSGLVLIAESHAAIHTWVDEGVAWFELATCGDKRALEQFRQRCILAGFSSKDVVPWDKLNE